MSGSERCNSAAVAEQSIAAVANNNKFKIGLRKSFVISVATGDSGRFGGALAGSPSTL